MQFKRCFKCLIELPLSAFYKHSRMRDGRLNKCVECTKKDANANRLENIERIRKYDKARASMPHRVAARSAYQNTEQGKAAMRKARMKYRMMNPDRRKAHELLGNAVRDKKVIPWPVCAVPDCRETKVEGHHADYTNPLGVTWLCKFHHLQLHKEHREAA